MKGHREIEQNGRLDLLMEAIRRAGWETFRSYPRASQSAFEMPAVHARELVTFVEQHTSEDIHWQLSEDKYGLDTTVGCPEAECLVVVSVLSHRRLRRPSFPDMGCDREAH